MFTYAFELLLWPCFTLNQVGAAISSSTSKSRLYGHINNKERRRMHTSAFIGGCFKCLQFMTCNKMGGGKFRVQSDLKDVAVAFMEFFNNTDAFNFDIVLSDIWLAFKLLGRIHRERKYKLSQQAKRDKEIQNGGQISPRADAEVNLTGTDESGGDRDIFFAFEDKYLTENKDLTENTIESLNLNTSGGDGNTPNSFRRRILHHDDETDMYHIGRAARYSHYALGVYDLYPDALIAAKLLDGGKSGIFHPGIIAGESLSLESSFRLTEFGFDETAIVYATLSNDILHTPYSILVDEQDRSVVVSIRGTNSIEDLVTDLQFSNSEFESVGEMLGFDGSGKYIHRGMLAKCKWIFNDIMKRKILSGLVPTSASNNSGSCQYAHFNLIFTGHSLGAGIAAILSTMFKPLYPDLRCYAFCPPGCSVSINLALECRDYVISIVVANDVIPRIRGSNFELL